MRDESADLDDEELLTQEEELMKENEEALMKNNDIPMRDEGKDSEERELRKQEEELIKENEAAMQDAEMTKGEDPDAPLPRSIDEVDMKQEPQERDTNGFAEDSTMKEVNGNGIKKESASASAAEDSPPTTGFDGVDECELIQRERKHVLSH